MAFIKANRSFHQVPPFKCDNDVMSLERVQLYKLIIVNFKIMLFGIGRKPDFLP
jgi:hypothetical protein